jgi:5-methyltetrahydropteroyltriglutamate--homocysteine methyltransferase
VINRVVRGLPAAFARHAPCRGNRGGRWHAEGGYEAVAERLFNALDIDPSPSTIRPAGSFAPLALYPRTSPSFGLVSTKMVRTGGRSERRIEEASRHADVGRLAISPHRFASVDSGNPLSMQAQEVKLRRVVEIAESVW